MTVIDLPRNRERTETLHHMLLRYPEARAQAKGEGGRGGQFSSAILVFDPLTWDRSYRELERCLTQLRQQAAARGPLVAHGVTSGEAWWHLSHRYLLCTVGRKDVGVHVNRKTGHRTPMRLPANWEVVGRSTLLMGKKASVTVRVWDSRVEPGKVQAALEWLSEQYRGEPRLPEALVA